MSDPVKSVALLWHTIGHQNLGVDALARSQVMLIRRAAESVGLKVRFTTVGTGQNYDAPELPADLVIGPEPKIKRMLAGRSPYLKVIRHSDIVFDIGEGDSFADIYGQQRFMSQFASKLAVILCGKPLVLSPQTIGPFNHPATRVLAFWLMRRAKAVFARDHLSTAFLQDNGLNKNIGEFIDVAFALPFTPQPKSPDRVRVGLNVSGLLYNEGYTGKNELGMALNYKTFSQELIETFLQRGAEVHLISHVSGSRGPDDDEPVMRELAEKYPEVIAAPIFGTASQAKSYMSGLDFMVAGRMHACIGAFSAAVPVIPVAYSRKFNGLFGSLNYGHLVDGRTTNTQNALAEVIKGFEAREILAAAIQQSLLIASAKLARYQERIAQLLVA